MTSSNQKIGDGDPSCQQCFGAGVVRSVPTYTKVTGTRPCRCVLERDVLLNVERGWRGLSQFDPVPSSPLVGMTETNLYVTASSKLTGEHVRHVAVRQGPRWLFNVVSDAQLMDAWLSRVDDTEVFDSDVIQARNVSVSGKFGALVDMIEPPALLIVVVGVKAARNSAMPEVLAETLQHRLYLQKPTWVIDRPDYRLTNGHISYSDIVGSIVSRWRHIVIEPPNTLRMPPVVSPPVVSSPKEVMSRLLADINDESPDEDPQLAYARSIVDGPSEEKKKKKWR